MKTVLTADPDQAGLRLDAFLSAASGELSRSHIQNSLSRLHPREIRKKHRVHAETELSGILDQFQPLKLQVVQALPRLYKRCISAVL